MYKTKAYKRSLIEGSFVIAVSAFVVLLIITTVFSAISFPAGTYILEFSIPTCLIASLSCFIGLSLSTYDVDNKYNPGRDFWGLFLASGLSIGVVLFILGFLIFIVRKIQQYPLEVSPYYLATNYGTACVICAVLTSAFFYLRHK